jgi:ribosome production factor 2
MAVLKTIKKPKTKAGTRALKARESKQIENTKQTIFVRGVKCSKTIQDCMSDLKTIKQPHAISYNQKNDIKPFEDHGKLEFYGRKNDASMFMFGSHNKKRPDNIVFGRLYDFNLLDMIEFGVENYQSINSFKNSKVTAGAKPCLVFAGEEFADTTNLEMQRVKSLFIDFFRGDEVDNVRLAGLEHVLQFTSHGNKVYMRSYKIYLKKSGLRTPRIELEEIGPHLDLNLRRSHLASEDLFRTACKQVKNARKKKVVKNITEDVFGSKVGRVHIQPQEIRTIQNRKIKALKETKEEKEEKKAEDAAKEAESKRQNNVAAIFGSEMDES